MEFKVGDTTIVVMNEPTYTSRSADNLRRYEREVALGGAYVSSRHGVIATLTTGEIYSSILLGGGGATGVHERSLVHIDGTLYVACGNEMCALSLPRLEVKWHRQVDVAACFGVYELPSGAGLISHGELEIARIALDGTEVWSASGNDIFTGSFAIGIDAVHATDWNGLEYRLRLIDGCNIGA